MRMYSSISGGSYFRTNTVKGRVSNVTFADDFLTTQTQVQNVYLGNLNLAPTLAKMTTILPPSVKTIDFTNGLLTTFPADFAQFATLQELYVYACYKALVELWISIHLCGWCLQDAHEQLHCDCRRKLGHRHDLTTVRAQKTRIGV